MTTKRPTLSLPVGAKATKPTAPKPTTARKAKPDTPRAGAKPREQSGAEQTRRTPRASADNADRLFTPRGTRAEDRWEAAKQHRRSAESPAKPRPPRETEVAPADGKVRLSKLMSEQGICSRREADAYIAKGWVFVDGQRISELGTRISPDAKITLDRQAEAQQSSRVTVLLHKPIGYVSGQAEDGYEPASVLVVPERQVADDWLKFRPEHRRGLAPAGRLDIDSTGLLVLTEDGRVAKHLIGEDSTVEKEYLVRVEGVLDDRGLALLNHGLALDGEELKPAKVYWQNKDQLRFVLTEGRKRQIRRMCELVGLKVTALKRIRIGKVMLGDLPIGQWRFLRRDENF